LFGKAGVTRKRSQKNPHPTEKTLEQTKKVFFGFYRKLSGMTGTASAATAEFFESYRLRVRGF
jgi:preprotein translocase subunit SecA